MRESVIGTVIVELRSGEKVHPAHKKQVLTYMRLAGMKLGYLLNFGESLMKDGITRIINGQLPPCSPCLVGLPVMVDRLFEPFREWPPIGRRRKGSKKPRGRDVLRGARVPCGGDGRRRAASGEINLCLEPPCGEFITEQRSPEASWLNIKQLTEPAAGGR